MERTKRIVGGLGAGLLVGVGFLILYHFEGVGIAPADFWYLVKVHLTLCGTLGLIIGTLWAFR